MRTAALQRRIACAAAALGLTLAGCMPGGDPRLPIPVDVRAAPMPPADALVVVLPGVRDDLDTLRGAGIAEVFARRWPRAEVVLAEATLAYYREGGLARRLHEEIVAPAKARGIREVWLCGASLGGFGAIRHALDHPGDIDGLILLAPYLGEEALVDAIATQGGLRAYDPGPPEPVTADNVAVEVWKALARWAREPASAPQVWIAVGRDDPFMRAVPLLRELVPPQRLLLRDGGHRWRVWTPAAEEIAAAIAAQRAR